MDNIGFQEIFPEEKYNFDVEKCNQVFVYGTLKTGGEIRGLNNMGLNVSPKGKSKTSYADYQMLDLGSFPGLLKGKNAIIGEVWQVDAEALFVIDGMEGFNREEFNWENGEAIPNFGNADQNSFYTRTIIETSEGRAWVYFLSESQYGKYKDLESDNIEMVNNAMIWHN
jgi:gamma-glutamylcyclotransferase (GGCT)/AIG2-like uncharacterized protein YtfP